MYKLKPLYNFSDNISLPDCMYTHPVLLSHDAPSSAFDNAFLLELENRQEQILKRLESLKEKVAALTEGSKSQVVSESKEKADAEKVTDVVISANPTSPPLALLVLLQRLSEQRNVLALCHRHSSAATVPPHLMRCVTSSKNKVDRSSADLIVTIIWKNVEHGPELMVDPQTQSVVQGEAVIARYLARLLRPSYDDTNPRDATLLDQWIDSASLFLHGNSKEQNAVLKSANAQLGKSAWLGGEGESLADVMMWSAVSRTPASHQALPAKVQQWYVKCCDLPDMKAVLQAAVRPT